MSSFAALFFPSRNWISMCFWEILTVVLLFHENRSGHKSWWKKGSSKNTTATRIFFLKNRSVNKRRRKKGASTTVRSSNAAGNSYPWEKRRYFGCHCACQLPCSCNDPSLIIMLSIAWWASLFSFEKKIVLDLNAFEFNFELLIHLKLMLCEATCIFIIWLILGVIFIKY